MVPTVAENKMMHDMSVETTGDTRNPNKQMRPFLEEWAKFRDYLESPLGERLLDEVNKNAERMRQHRLIGN